MSTKVFLGSLDITESHKQAQPGIFGKDVMSLSHPNVKIGAELVTYNARFLILTGLICEGKLQLALVSTGSLI